MKELKIGQPIKVGRCLYRIGCILNDDASEDTVLVTETSFNVIYNDFTEIEVSITGSDSISVDSNSDWIKISKRGDLWLLLCHPTKQPKIGEVRITSPTAINTIIITINQILP